jgi:DNA (cytosine-5)-methyltransferase 1
MIKAFSMFTGIGGFELGLKKISIEHEVVGFSEIDPIAATIFNKHFPRVKNYGDATKIKGNELPNFDLLFGGFPCQSFSIAEKREGFDDVRGTLFFDIARILSIKKPQYLVLENVKGLLSHDDGHTFSTILRVLAELGYSTEWKVFNSKNYGVPQHRERVYITGHFRTAARPKILFI